MWLFERNYIEVGNGFFQKVAPIGVKKPADAGKVFNAISQIEAPLGALS